MERGTGGGEGASHDSVIHPLSNREMSIYVLHERIVLPRILPVNQMRKMLFLLF